MKKKPISSPTPHQRWKRDLSFTENYFGLVGVDEAGRGCFAGPVVVGAVFLKKEFYQEAKFKKACKDFNDSKQVLPEKRLELMQLLKQWKEKNLLNYSWNRAESSEIDQHNILGATKIAMQRAIDGLIENSKDESLVLPKMDDNSLFHSSKNQNALISKLIIDGRPLKNFPYSHESLVQGDSHSLVIAMASIVAKVQRDLLMQQLDLVYPCYGFKSHKGYGTPQHRQAIERYGLCIEHRRSFIHSTQSPDLKDTSLKYKKDKHEECLLFPVDAVDMQL